MQKLYKFNHIHFDSKWQIYICTICIGKRSCFSFHFEPGPPEAMIVIVVMVEGADTAEMPIREVMSRIKRRRQNYYLFFV